MDEATAKAWSEPTVDRLHLGFCEALASLDGDFAAREGAALALANELVRRWTERELGRLSEAYGDEIVVDGRHYRRHSEGVRRYHSLCGAVEVRRSLYRQIGVHNGPTVVPLEIEAGILENATPALATSVTQSFASMPLRHYEAEMRAAHRRVPSRSTLERIGKRVGSQLHERLPSIEPALRAAVALPTGAHSISVGLDRTTIPMAEPCELRRRRRRRRKSYARKPPPPVTVAFRMAYVATIAVHGRDARTLTSVRLAATANEGPDELLCRLGAELRCLLEQAPTLPVVVVQDGAPELWTLVEEWLRKLDVRMACGLIDRYHVDERLAASAAAVEKDVTKARRLLDRWRHALNHDSDGARRICRDLARALHGPRKYENDFWPIDRGRVQWVDRHVVDGNLGYFLRHASKMNYAAARRRHFPIGSGVTEGACKSVIAARFKRSGQRWSETGASTCLLLRTLHLDARLPSCVELFAKSRRETLAC